MASATGLVCPAYEGRLRCGIRFAGGWHGVDQLSGVPLNWVGRVSMGECYGSAACSALGAEECCWLLAAAARCDGWMKLMMGSTVQANMFVRPLSWPHMRLSLHGYALLVKICGVELRMRFQCLQYPLTDSASCAEGVPSWSGCLVETSVLRVAAVWWVAVLSGPVTMVCLDCVLLHACEYSLLSVRGDEQHACGRPYTCAVCACNTGV